MDMKHKDIEILSVDDEIDPNTVTTPFEIPAPKLPKGKQPRNLQDRSKYGPHQGQKERERRIAQVLEGGLDVSAEVRADTEALVMERFNKRLVELGIVAAEDRQDPPATEEV